MPFIQFILAFAMFIVFCQFNYGAITQVQLKENVDVPVVIDGELYGTNTLQTGTIFLVYEVKEDAILLKHLGKIITVAKSKTDYDDQVNIIKAKEEEVRLAKEKAIQEQNKKELLEQEELAIIDADRALLKDEFPRQVMLNIKMDVTKINPKDGKPYVYRSLPAGQLYTINNKPEYKIGNKLTLEYYECFVAVAISNTDLRERISAAKAQMIQEDKEQQEAMAFNKLQVVGQQIEDIIKKCDIKYTATKVIVPGKPDTSGGYSIIIISSESIFASSSAETSFVNDSYLQKGKNAWLALVCGAVGKYTRESSIPFNTIIVSDINTVKEQKGYSISVSLCQKLQQQMYDGQISLEDAFVKINSEMKPYTTNK